jgi:hypothetical protein
MYACPESIDIQLDEEDDDIFEKLTESSMANNSDNIFV